MYVPLLCISSVWTCEFLRKRGRSQVVAKNLVGAGCPALLCCLHQRSVCGSRLSSSFLLLTSTLCLREQAVQLFTTAYINAVFVGAGCPALFCCLRQSCVCGSRLFSSFLLLTSTLCLRSIRHLPSIHASWRWKLRTTLQTFRVTWTKLLNFLSLESISSVVLLPLALLQ
jgi:hypothetical protein